MKFVYLTDWHNDWKWWLWTPETMTLCNFNGGGFDIDENADYWITAIVYQFEDWHELYCAKGVNPLKVDVTSRDVWISPEGEFFEGEAHSVAAEKITKLVYGKEFDYFSMYDAEDFLTDHKWVKATTSFMWKLYIKEDKEWEMTQKTFDSLFDYCKAHKLDMPKKVRII